MNKQMEFAGEEPQRQVMNGKPVFTVDSTVLNLESNFQHKLLCDGPTFSTGTACVYSCAFCYVPDLVRKLRAIRQYAEVQGEHERIVIRRAHAIDKLRSQLTDRHGLPKYKKPEDRRVIYASPLVDVAGNMDLVRETIEACRLILELTNWDIRLLSKSNLLPKVAEGLGNQLWAIQEGEWRQTKERVIYGVSTGTLGDELAKAFEAGTALVSKRIESLHWLQDNGYRTFGMICPSLPQTKYWKFAREMADAIRADKCEHVWAEVINLRGESFKRTIDSLKSAGFFYEADCLEVVSADRFAWERYAQATFNAHAAILPKGKLRFLQYVTPSSRAWWSDQVNRGAILL